MGRRRRRVPGGFFRKHSLSLLLAAMVVLLVLVYAASDPSTHFGSFAGNAIADWCGVLVFVVATKYFFEVGSSQSRTPPRHLHQRFADFLLEHSLTLVLLATAIAWLVVYAQSDVDGKAGQVVGNMASDWTQILGLVVMTKYARERGSKEGEG